MDRFDCKCKYRKLRNAILPLRQSCNQVSGFGNRLKSRRTANVYFASIFISLCIVLYSELVNSEVIAVNKRLLLRYVM